MTPNSIEKLRENIDKLKAEIPKKDHFGKIPKIAKLQSTVMLREIKKKKLESLPDFLDVLSDKAYPGVKELVNEDPDALEAKFTKEAKSPEDVQAQDKESETEEDGFSEEILPVKNFNKDQTQRDGPDEKPWRVMKVGDSS